MAWTVFPAKVKRTQTVRLDSALIPPRHFASVVEEAERMGGWYQEWSLPAGMAAELVIPERLPYDEVDDPPVDAVFIVALPSSQTRSVWFGVGSGEVDYLINMPIDISPSKTELIDVVRSAVACLIGRHDGVSERFIRPFNAMQDECELNNPVEIDFLAEFSLEDLIYAPTLSSIDGRVTTAQYGYGSSNAIVTIGWSGIHGRAFLTLQHSRNTITFPVLYAIDDRGIIENKLAITKLVLAACLYKYCANSLPFSDAVFIKVNYPSLVDAIP